MNELSRVAAERRQARSERPAPQGHEWGVCQSVHRVGGSRARTVAKVLLAGGFVITAYLAPGLAAPAENQDVLVQVAKVSDQPWDSSIVVG